jgi:hypothetical protein
MKISDDMMPAESTGGRYLNKIEDGQKVLFVDDPKGCFEWWVEEGGKRTPKRAKLSAGKPPHPEAKMVWLAPVLDLSDNRKKLWTVSQKSIQKAVMKLAKDPDYNLNKMPVKIGKEGTGMETRYSVNVLPEIQLTDEQKKEAGKFCDPMAVIEDGDPFDDGMPF